MDVAVVAVLSDLAGILGFKEEKYSTWEVFLCQKDLFYSLVCFDNVSVDHQQETLSFCVAIAWKITD